MRSRDPPFNLQAVSGIFPPCRTSASRGEAVEALGRPWGPWGGRRGREEGVGRPWGGCVGVKKMPQNSMTSKFSWYSQQNEKDFVNSMGPE